LKSKNTRPPKAADKFLGWLCKGEFLEEILGDLYEYHHELIGQPRLKRNIAYWFHVFNFLRPGLLKNLSGTQKLNFYGMIKLFLKTTTRNFLRQRLISSMSLLSLIFGAVCFQLVYVWVHNEISVDSFHEKIDRIHVSTVKSDPYSDFFALSFSGFFNVGYDQFPQVRSTLNVHRYREDEIRLTANNTDFQGIGFVVDSTFFDFFDFPLADGGSGNILADPANIVISERFANRVFASTDVIGQIVEIRCDQKGTYQIAGVLEKIPSNSSMYFDFLIPRHSQNFWRRIPQELFLTDEYFNADHFNQTVSKMGRSDPRFAESTLASVPYNSIYLDHAVDLNLFNKYGDRNSINTMVFISIIILLITMLGFTSLQTTLQLSSVKKMGVKQIAGASKLSLCIEIAVSRLFYLVISTVVAFLVFELIFPYYLAIMEIKIDRTPVLDIAGILTVTSATVIVSLIFAIFQVFKIETKEAMSNKLTLLKVPKIQRLLTTIQYSVTIILLVATTIVFIQFRYMLNKETGFHSENIVSIDFFEIMRGNDAIEEKQRALTQHQFVIDKMTQNPDILQVSQGAMPISSMVNVSSWKVAGNAHEFTSQNTIAVDPEYAGLLGIEIVAGRFFSDSLDQHSQQKVVINQAALKYWDIEDISQARMVRGLNRQSGEEDFFEIIGVVKNYHYEHLSNKIKPLVMRFNPYRDDSFLVSVRTEKVNDCLIFLEELFKEVNLNGIFNYELLEDKVEAQYAKEKRIGKVYFAFTLVALLLSSIGLFTFAFYETRRRTKEIGIRKVNGASILNVFSLLSYSFLKSILLAYIVACPVAWFLMDHWLDNFAYRTQLSWWIFMLVGSLTIFMAALAVGWQTWDAARKNPVDSLRYE